MGRRSGHQGDRGTPRGLHILARSTAILIALGSTAALAQQADPPAQDRAPATGDATTPDDDKSDIIVTGRRGSAVTNIPALATFDADAIAATGATSISELLRTIKGVTTATDGSDPIFLLNGQRVSGYDDIGALPPEAIDKVEVLPEAAALKFGFPPTRRIVNFITKRRFKQTSVRVAGGTTTRAGSTTQESSLSLTRLHDDRRLTLSLEAKRTDPLAQSDRDIAPDPGIAFDAIGNVVGVTGGEIDPALSAAAGHIVTIAPVPNAGDPTSLAAFATGSPRIFDLSPYRSLAPRNETIKGNVIVADKVTDTVSGSFSVSAEQSRDHSRSGPAAATLFVPAGDPYSPFSGPVLVKRYLTEADGLRDSQTVTTLHAGGTLRGSIAGWRWDFTAALDQKQTDGIGEQGIDSIAANAAIAAGANPFVPLDPSLLTARQIDRSRLRTRTANAKAVATNSPIRLPAGKVTVTASAEIERATSASSTRGYNPFDLELGRTRAEGGIALDIPIASAREQFLPVLGELSVNGSVNARRVSGFGSLTDSTYGVAWAPITAIQFLANIKRSETAPDMTLQATPEVRVPNVPIFDLGTGRTELVTLTLGGNPGLLAERKRVESIGFNIKPFAQREWRLAMTYEDTRIDNQTGTVYAITPQTQAILPDLFQRDANGRLIAVAYRPTNFYRERLRVLQMTINTYGMLGKPPPPPAEGSPPSKPPQRRSYYAGIGPSIKFSDRLQLRPGTPEFDLLAGDTVNGGGTPRIYGYAYGGSSYLGNGGSFDFYVTGANRVRGADPASDLRYSALFKLNLSGYISLHHFLPKQEWTSHTQIKLEVRNATDARQRVRNGNGRTPFRLQRDYLDPIGRTVTLSVRKVF